MEEENEEKTEMLKKEIDDIISEQDENQPKELFTEEELLNKNFESSIEPINEDVVTSQESFVNTEDVVAGQESYVNEETISEPSIQDDIKELADKLNIDNIQNQEPIADPIDTVNDFDVPETITEESNIVDYSSDTVQPEPINEPIVNEPATYNEPVAPVDNSFPYDNMEQQNDIPNNYNIVEEIENETKRSGIDSGFWTTVLILIIILAIGIGILMLKISASRNQYNNIGLDNADESKPSFFENFGNEANEIINQKSDNVKFIENLNDSI